MMKVSELMAVLSEMDQDKSIRLFIRGKCIGWGEAVIDLDANNIYPCNSSLVRIDVRIESDD